MARTTPTDAKQLDLEGEVKALRALLDDYRRELNLRSTLLEYACNLVTGNTARNRDVEPLDDHPETQREVAVEDCNAPGQWRIAAYGFDSDVAELFTTLRALARERQVAS